MLIYKGGQKTGKGTYWDMGTGRRVDILEEEILPGVIKTVYLRLSPFAMLLLSPILGLFYVLFLPVAGVFLTLFLAGQKLWQWMLRLTRRLALGLIRRLAHFEWRASEAYLSGKKNSKKKEGRSDKGPAEGEEGKRS